MIAHLSTRKQVVIIALFVISLIIMVGLILFQKGIISYPSKSELTTVPVQSPVETQQPNAVVEDNKVPGPSFGSIQPLPKDVTIPSESEMKQIKTSEIPPPPLPPEAKQSVPPLPPELKK